MKILIPIGNYPDLKKALLANINETAGYDHEVIFLSGKSIQGIHLNLLDDAFRSINDEWVMVQHADLFWRDKGWLNQIYCHLQNTKFKAFVPKKTNYTGGFDYHEYKFAKGSSLLYRTHDFLGVYNRKFIVDNNYTFRGGELSSLPQKNYLYEIKNILTKKYLSETDIMDGSDLIGLELGLDGLVGELKIKARFDHAWGTFANDHYMTNKDNQIEITRNISDCMRGLPTFSWLTTHYEFDKIFPWRALKYIRKKSQPHHVIKTIQRYVTPVVRNFNVTVIKFSDKRFVLPFI